MLLQMIWTQKVLTMQLEWLTPHEVESIFSIFLKSNNDQLKHFQYRVDFLKKWAGYQEILEFTMLMQFHKTPQNWNLNKGFKCYMYYFCS